MITLKQLRREQRTKLDMFEESIDKDIIETARRGGVNIYFYQPTGLRDKDFRELLDKYRSEGYNTTLTDSNKFVKGAPPKYIASISWRVEDV